MLVDHSFFATLDRFLGVHCSCQFALHYALFLSLTDKLALIGCHVQTELNVAALRCQRLERDAKNTTG